MRQCCACGDATDMPDAFTARCKKCFLRYYKFQELENGFCLVWRSKTFYNYSTKHAPTDIPVIAKVKDLMHNYWDRDIYYHRIPEESKNIVKTSNRYANDPNIVKTANQYANDPNVERACLAWKMK